ncbi:hypothetical protein NQ314_004024 [Rhamnusium bicolor]|uniref:Uncharacterized protein n=1 Tax=Rhamnusium bicolor TaxID=1586634 RepID=A0AAV8ZK83_9CUCU|nr:hypothetical protein NQ314_004024 [Rhamnusium bicolor]
MKAVIFMAVFVILEALHCDKEFNYYDDYGNGFDITCQGISEKFVHLLENITITNEISLTIENSTLTNISSNLFRNVRNIRCLYLENSTFNFSRMQSVFETLKKLEHLIVVNTKFFVNRYTFAGLSMLKELILSNNNLEEVEIGSFEHLPRVKYLQLTNNKIADMKNLPLCELNALRYLNLSNNAISSLEEVHFYCRKPTKVVDLNLNNENYLLNISKPDYFSVTDISFQLFSIDLSYNNISKLGHSLADLSNLKVLNLEGNRLVKITNKELHSLGNLKKGLS